MKLAISVIVVFFSSCLILMAAQRGLTIQGGKVVLNGGYMAIGSTQTVMAVAPAGTTGQCMGMLCGVTYPN